MVFGFLRVEGVAALRAARNGSTMAERLMARASGIVAAGIRDTDLLTRTRDDELLVVLDASVDEAATIAERLRARIADESTLIGPAGLPRRLSGVMVPVLTALILAPETTLAIAGEKARKVSRRPAGRIACVPMLAFGDRGAPDRSVSTLARKESGPRTKSDE